MEKTLVIAGSNSANSINQWLASELGKINDVDYFDIRLLDVPMYSINIENSTGYPQPILDFYTKLRTYKNIIIVSPEHNGYTPAYFKSFLDWISRVERFYLKDINLVIVSVVPGKKAGASVRQMLSTMLGFAGAHEVGNFGIPHFNSDNDYTEQFNDIINCFK